MALELIDATSTGLFNRTLFGNDPLKSPETVDLFTTGTLNSKLAPTVNSTPQSTSNAFKTISPKGLKSVSNDPYVQNLSKFSGKSASTLVNDLVNKAPSNVDSLGTLFDDGMSFEQADSLIDRLNSVIPKQSLDFLDNDDFTQALKMTESATKHINKKGSFLGELCAKNKVSRSTNGSRKGNDQGAIMGFISAVLSSISKCDKSVLISNSLSSLGVKFGLDSDLSDTVSIISADRISKTGGFKQVKELTDGLTPGKLGINEKKGLASNIVSNFTIPETVQKADRKNFSNEVVDYLDSLDSGWSTKKVNGNTITDMEKLSKASPDLKELMLSNDEYASKFALSTSSFF